MITFLIIMCAQRRRKKIMRMTNNVFLRSWNTNKVRLADGTTYRYLTTGRTCTTGCLRANFEETVRDPHVTRASHVRHTHVDCPYMPRRRKRVCTFLLRALYDHRIAGSPQEVRTKPARDTCVSRTWTTGRPRALRGCCDQKIVWKLRGPYGRPPVRPVVRLA